MEFESVDGMRDVLERYKMLAEEKKNVGEQVSRLGRGEGY